MNKEKNMVELISDSQIAFTNGKYQVLQSCQRSNINGEEIITTDNHPFYVQGRGFIEAGSLLAGV